MTPPFETFADDIAAFGIRRSQLEPQRAAIEIALQAAIERKDDCPEEAFIESMLGQGAANARFVEVARLGIEHAVYAVLLDIRAHRGLSRRSVPREVKPASERERHYTEADDEAIRAEIAAKVPWKEIQAKYGCSFSHVVKIRRGWRRKRLVAKLSDEQVARIKSRLAAGETGRHVAEAEGVSEPTVSQIKHGKVHSDVAAAEEEAA